MGWKGTTPKEFGKHIKSNSDAFLQRRVYKIFQQVVILSPVDTGAFRGNNRIGIGGMQSGWTETVDLNGVSTLENGKRQVLLIKLGDLVYIYNNLPYARALEDGHSGQAPQGIYSQAAQMGR